MNEMTASLRVATSGNSARVLIVDDSLVMRSLVERHLELASGFKVVGSVAGAGQALSFLASNRVDLVILDIEMPNRSGLDALPDILHRANGARVLVMSGLCNEGGPAAVKALALGACDTLEKPGRHIYSQAFGATLVERLRALALAPNSKAHETFKLARVKPKVSALECLAVGASTGGIGALHQFLENLDSRIDAPILLTQHLPEAFMPFLAKQLADMGLRRVEVAVHGARLDRGCIYVAPGNANLICKSSGGRTRIQLSNDWNQSRYLPAVDPMLISVAECFGHSAAGVVLSGMGVDGLIGAKALADVGAPVYVQCPDTSVVWGMPGAIAKAGLATAVMTPGQIAEYIAACWLEPQP